MVGEDGEVGKISNALIDNVLLSDKVRSNWKKIAVRVIIGR